MPCESPPKKENLPKKPLVKNVGFGELTLAFDKFDTFNARTHTQCGPVPSERPAFKMSTSLPLPSLIHQPLTIHAAHIGPEQGLHWPALALGSSASEL